MRDEFASAVKTVQDPVVKSMSRVPIGEDHVGFRRQRVGRGRADDADRADMRGVVVRDRAFAGDRLGDRDAARLGELAKSLLGTGIAHAAAGDDQRPLCAFEERDRLGQPVAVGARARDRHDGRLEEGFGIVAGDLLRVLRQSDEGRAAIGRVEHRRHRLRQRADDLLGMDDAVPVAA